MKSIFLTNRDKASDTGDEIGSRFSAVKLIYICLATSCALRKIRKRFLRFLAVIPMISLGLTPKE